MTQPKPDPTRVAERIADATEPARSLASSLLGQGWDAVVLRGDRIRFWCSGPCKHETWVHLAAVELTYFSRLRKHLQSMTCWKEATE